MPRFPDNHSRSFLLKKGLELKALALPDGFTGSLDNCTVQVTASGGEIHSTRILNARLGSRALMGFGALVGFDKQLAAFFPEGTDFQLAVNTVGVPDTWCSVGNTDDTNLVYVDGMAHADPEPLLGGVWMDSDGIPEVADDLSYDLHHLQTPQFIVVAADFTMRVAERLALSRPN